LGVSVILLDCLPDSGWWFASFSGMRMCGHICFGFLFMEVALKSIQIHMRLTC